MGAPTGNQFWKLRSKHGRDKIFESPDILWEESCKYFEWCDVNPLTSTEQSRSKGTKKTTEVTEEGIETVDSGLIEMPLMRAYTWEGLELFLDLESLREYKTNKDYKDFSQVITRIGKIIYTQKFTGAASGLFNANIIARDLGLSDSSKTEITDKTQKVHKIEIVRTKSNEDESK